MTLFSYSALWLFIGFFGQFIFFLRFIVQWWESEKKGDVVIPIGFWYLSIAGTIIILIYSIHIRDIVFTVAQIASLFIYARNLMLIHAQKSSKAKDPLPSTPPVSQATDRAL